MVRPLEHRRTSDASDECRRKPVEEQTVECGETVVGGERRVMSIQLSMDARHSQPCGRLKCSARGARCNVRIGAGRSLGLA